MPVSLHPDNPKILSFRGQPKKLLCATEHYGAVLNRRFNFERYLADAAARRQTLTRLFLLFRELQTALNPKSTCKPDTIDFVAPFLRTGPGRGLDRFPRFDLSQWDPEFFHRLHGFLSTASDYGIVVEVVLFSNTYSDIVWSLNPMNSGNNINELPDFPWPEYMTLRHPELWMKQKAYIEKIVTEINRYDNIFFETCNEPGSSQFNVMDNPPSPIEVNEWQMAVADTIRNSEKDLDEKHLIAGHEAYSTAEAGTKGQKPPMRQGLDATMDELNFDIANMHPLTNMSLRGKRYDLGQFMMKRLNLEILRDYCLAAWDEAKPLNLDEDNTATMYMDFDSWTIHRKRAWTAQLCGAHYDFIDYAINPGWEAGTPESGRTIRTWMKNLSEYIHSLDIVKGRPLTDLVVETPKFTLASAFGTHGKAYTVYLADSREVDDSGYGKDLSGKIVLRMPKGEFSVALYSPAAGQYSSWTGLIGDDSTSIKLPVFRDDIVIRIRRH